MDRTRLQKIAAELERARMKREHWDNRVKDLERKYQEAERTCIHEMVHAANLSPEQLEGVAGGDECWDCGKHKGCPDVCYMIT